MEKAVRLKVRKDLGSCEQANIIKLKGNLISRGYTEIVHILDQDDDFHINTFETSGERLNELQQFIATFIKEENLSDSISFK